tara:strand:+ start:3567 stop:4181 length:615 start_codon:yes stop_codon:yes gene_type:complete
MKNNAVIIDYGMGNIKSLENLIKKCNFDLKVSTNKKVINNSDLIILPGVGNFGKAVENLKKKKIFKFIKIKILKDKVPTIGICLGMHLFFKKSEENKSENGLNIFNYKIEALRKYNTGWAKIKTQKKLKEEDFNFDSNYYYFNHKYALLKKFKYTKSFVSNLYPANAIILKKNIIGFQFHPEKSQKSGEKVFKYFLKSKFGFDV